jgi:hypothetical protein
MKSHVVVLFTGPEAIDRALVALRRAGLREINSQIIENLSQDGPDMPDAKLSALTPEAGWSDQPTPRYTETELLATMGLDDDAIAFFSQGMEMGGQLLVLTVDERDTGKVREIVTENEGQVFSRS